MQRTCGFRVAMSERPLPRETHLRKASRRPTITAQTVVGVRMRAWVQRYRVLARSPAWTRTSRSLTTHLSWMNRSCGPPHRSSRPPKVQVVTPAKSLPWPEQPTRSTPGRTPPPAPIHHGVSRVSAGRDTRSTPPILGGSHLMGMPRCEVAMAGDAFPVDGRVGAERPQWTTDS